MTKIGMIGVMMEIMQVTTIEYFQLVPCMSIFPGTYYEHPCYNNADLIHSACFLFRKNFLKPIMD